MYFCEVDVSVEKKERGGACACVLGKNGGVSVLEAGRTRRRALFRTFRGHSRSQEPVPYLRFASCLYREGVHCSRRPGGLHALFICRSPHLLRIRQAQALTGPRL